MDGKFLDGVYHMEQCKHHQIHMQNKTALAEFLFFLTMIILAESFTNKITRIKEDYYNVNN
jgi:hypothetical protein